jgi:hypothetical protein
MHTATRDRGDGGRLATPAQPTRSCGSARFIGLTILTLGLYMYFGVLVVIDAGAEASEPAHLVGAIGCTAIVAAGLLPSCWLRPGTSRPSSACSQSSPPWSTRSLQ